MRTFAKKAKENINAFIDKLTQFVSWCDKHPSLEWIATIVLEIIFFLLKHQ